MYKPKNFSWEETKCKCGKESCNENVTDELMMIMDNARDLAGIPFIVTSGARDAEYNRAIGGKDTSSHTRGLAVDIKASGSRERYLICKAFSQVGATRFGLDKSFVHVDIDREKEQQVTWLY